MLRSLMSGVAGLKSYQTKMDVIGNNIANVNTIGFKSSNVNFSDCFYQKTQSATSASTLNQKAGTNPKQIGYGSSVASIATTVANQGGNQTTNRALDLMINGNAFFIIGMDGQNYFTKNGAFDIDGAGYLAGETGGLVMGWGVDPVTGNIVQDSVSPIRVYSPENQSAEPDATTDVYFQGNIDSNDVALEEGKVIQMDFYDNLGNQYAAKFKVISNNAEDENEYRVVLTDVIDSNEQSIFLESHVSGGATTYTKKDGVTIDFGGYTYKLDSFDKVTGEVTLKSYVVGTDGKETATQGAVKVPAMVNYNPDEKKAESYLYRLNGLKYEKIPASEIHLYVDVDAGTGALNVSSSADEMQECAFVYNPTNHTYTPITLPLSAENAGNPIETTVSVDDYLAAKSNALPYVWDTNSESFRLWDNAIDGTYSQALVNDATTGNPTIDLSKITTNGTGTKPSEIYYQDDQGNFKKVLTVGVTTATETSFTNATVKNLIDGDAATTVQQDMNLGGEILFNASTGKFASIKGSTSRYDDNGNLITNNVLFKVNTSNSRIETSAKDLFEEIAIDFSSLTKFADGGKSTVSPVRGNIETGLGAGWATGALTGVSVSNDGKIYGKYDNGVQKLLGQIAVTTFPNPTGLEACGNSLFQTTVNSGDFDGVGSDISAIGLSITSGALESSNVDLSNEFTNMITTQRGFEANSKIITTSDEMLDQLINLKR